MYVNDDFSDNRDFSLPAKLLFQLRCKKRHNTHLIRIFIHTYIHIYRKLYNKGKKGFEMGRGFKPEGGRGRGRGRGEYAAQQQQEEEWRAQQARKEEAKKNLPPRKKRAMKTTTAKSSSSSSSGDEEGKIVKVKEFDRFAGLEFRRKKRKSHRTRTILPLPPRLRMNI